MDAVVGSELDSGMEPDMDSQYDASDLGASLTDAGPAKSA